ncbi:PAS domain-containing protein [Maribacter sp. 2210JD10-5]|uniref:PAS domain-containing protein n=1 Tax=Maribacter sp. 2210JD10-5 TaxID=3386272 RepID=UPI0039BD3705
MDWTLIITGLISALSGGALASFLTFKLGNRKQDESEFATLVKEYKEIVENNKADLVELRNEVKEIRKDLTEAKLENQQLRNQLMIFESSNTDVPLPIWLKDTDGKMLFVNPEYERALLNPIGKSSEDYIGKTDVDVWGEETGKQFQAHDKKVMRSKKPMEFVERWKGMNGAEYEGRIIKYPRFLNRTVIGIGGIVVDFKEVM